MSLQDALIAQREPISAQLDRIRNEFVEHVWAGVIVIAVIGPVISASRAIQFGWRDVYSLHFALGILMVAAHVLRRRLTHTTRFNFVQVLLWIVGLAGIANFGLLGAGGWWMVFSALMIGTYYSTRAGVVALIASTSVIVIFGIAFVSEVLRTSMDANRYMTDPSPWLVLLITATVLPAFVLTAITTERHATRALLSEIERQSQQIRWAASHDSLTGLAQRAHAYEYLSEAMRMADRDKSRVAMMFVDLDGFKAVNDNVGHEGGDRVLADVAGRINAQLRTADLAGRIGGDEFLVILARVADAEEAHRIGREIVAAVEQPISFGSVGLTVGASIGISVYPDDGTDMAALLHLADGAMYECKRANRSAGNEQPIRN